MKDREIESALRHHSELAEELFNRADKIMQIFHFSQVKNVSSAPTGVLLPMRFQYFKSF